MTLWAQLSQPGLRSGDLCHTNGQLPSVIGLGRAFPSWACPFLGGCVSRGLFRFRKLCAASRVGRGCSSPTALPRWAGTEAEGCELLLRRPLKEATREATSVFPLRWGQGVERGCRQQNDQAKERHLWVTSWARQELGKVDG